jgi:hypothetical protein
MKKFVDSLEILQCIFGIILFITLVIVVFLQEVSLYIFLNRRSIQRNRPYDDLLDNYGMSVVAIKRVVK